MNKAISISNLLKTNFDTLPFTGEWLACCGCPQVTGSWFIYGAPKSGKTSFAMQLTKYLSNFGKVAYNSIEEGYSLTIQEAMKRVDMQEVVGKVVLLDKEGLNDLKLRLRERKSPRFVVIDSIQFIELQFKEYKELKRAFPDKLFIYISHIEGKNPDGLVARKIWRDANIAFRIEGFKAFPMGRYGGSEIYTINKARADEYWALN